MEKYDNNRNNKKVEIDILTQALPLTNINFKERISNDTNCTDIAVTKPGIEEEILQHKENNRKKIKKTTQFDIVPTPKNIFNEDKTDNNGIKIKKK